MQDKIFIKSIILRNYSYDYFHVEISVKMLVKPCEDLLHRVFFTDRLNHKTVNKTICRTLSANPHQLCDH